MKCVVPGNIHTPLQRVLLGLNPQPPTPLKNPSLGLYFPLKILAFKTPSPS